MAATLIAPIPADARPARLAQLYLGLILYGVSDALLVLSRLGLDPWDVLHQGLERHTGIAIGTWSILVGALVLLLWIPLRQRPGLGTLSNVVAIGATIDIVLSLAHAPHGTAARWACLLGGVFLNGVATGAYIGAGLGPGPRDGLMTGIARRGHSIRVVRTAIELSVLAAGWALGGTVGIGTLVYALSIGPLAHVFIPFFQRGVDTSSNEAGTPHGLSRLRQMGARRSDLRARADRR
ncbi:MAG: YczE/YyaS/YitT family protein [Gaiellaceae bacterium]